MSSTTDGRSQRGQALVLFALGLVAFLALAALVFDVGQSLADRRGRQNAADAAALAAARYVSDAATARAVALDIAEKNGYKTGVNGITVTVKIPPGPETNFAGLAGHVEVLINGSRGSFFSAVVGINSWNVSALAVAANTTGSAASFAFLSLDPHACGAAQFSGNADVNVAGNIQVNSDCGSAMKVTGNASVAVTIPNGECNVHGTSPGIQFGGNADLTCLQNPGAPVIPDPLAQLPAPPVPPAPAAAVELSGTKPVPAFCPGGATPATATNPGTCQFTSSYAGTLWRLSPGYYPGGIKVQGGTVLLQPGIYYLGGGGFSVNGTGANVYSVNAGATTPVTGGGVLLYNTEDFKFHNQCAAGTAPSPAVDCIQSISLNGAASQVHLLELQDSSVWSGLVIFQDRSILPSPEVFVNGNAGNLSVSGTIYAPTALVRINGNNGSTVTTQVIANTFLVNGSAGTLNVTFDGSSFYQFSGQGLVQ